jgi:hypothetical protein
MIEKVSTPERAERLMVCCTELPLSFRGLNYLRDKCKAVKKMLAYLIRAYTEGGRMCRVQEWSDGVALGEVFSDRLVRHWTLSFMHNSRFAHVAYKKRSSTSVIHDPCKMIHNFFGSLPNREP